MASIAVICMLVVLVAMIVDFISGWRKARQNSPLPENPLH